MRYNGVVAAAAATVMSLAGLTGCTSEEGHARPAPAGSAPSSAVLTVKEAAETYLRLSAASNAAREAWMRAPALSRANLAKHKQLAAHAADVTVAFSQELRKHRWPSQAQPYVTLLVEKLRERAAAYRRVAAAGTVSEYLTAAGRVPVTTSVASNVREALGLPRSPVVAGATPR